MSAKADQCHLETRNIFVLPTSSAPGVLVVRRSSHWYEMRGMSAGVATLTFDLCGATRRHKCKCANYSRQQHERFSGAYGMQERDLALQAEAFAPYVSRSAARLPA